MRDFRDAKSMARTLREALAAKHCKITVGESLELIGNLFGVSDWNTLSALIKNSDGGSKDTDRRGDDQGPTFARTTEAALHGALRAAHERSLAECSVEHLLLSLTEDPDAIAMMRARRVDPTAVRALLERSVEIARAGDGHDSISGPVPSPSFQRVVQRAILDAQASGEWNITGAHLLVAILSEQESSAARILREQGLSSQ